MNLFQPGLSSHAGIVKGTALMICVAVCLAGSGCRTAGPRTADAVPPALAESAAADLLLISATYGSGTSFADVSDRVNELIHEPGVEFFARPEWLHADPTPGWNKALVLVYEYKGRRRLLAIGEGGQVTANILRQRWEKQ
jgi:hypothetical protein